MVARGSLVLVVSLLGVGLVAAEEPRPAHLDPDLSPEQRAADLVGRMTLEEKVSQMMNDAESRASSRGSRAQPTGPTHTRSAGGRG